MISASASWVSSTTAWLVTSPRPTSSSSASRAAVHSRGVPGGGVDAHADSPPGAGPAPGPSPGPASHAAWRCAPSGVGVDDDPVAGPLEHGHIGGSRCRTSLLEIPSRRRQVLGPEHLPFADAGAGPTNRPVNCPPTTSNWVGSLRCRARPRWGGHVGGRGRQDGDRVASARCFSMWGRARYTSGSTSASTHRGSGRRSPLTHLHQARRRRHAESMSGRWYLAIQKGPKARKTKSAPAQVSEEQPARVTGHERPVDVEKSTNARHTAWAVYHRTGPCRADPRRHRVASSGLDRRYFVDLTLGCRRGSNAGPCV